MLASPIDGSQRAPIDNDACDLLASVLQAASSDPLSIPLSNFGEPNRALIAVSRERSEARALVHTLRTLVAADVHHTLRN